MSGPDLPVPPGPVGSGPLSPDSARMATVLSTIAVQARRTNLARAAEIRVALERSGGAGLDADGWAAAERTAHQLAGSAGTFGYAGASGLARELETALGRVAADDCVTPDAQWLAETSRLLDRLTEELAAEPELD